MKISFFNLVSSKIKQLWVIVSEKQEIGKLQRFDWVYRKCPR